VSIVGIIPCRYGAVRFPGKSLADIHGKPMMWHVYKQAEKAGQLDAVYIATDDERISSVCEALGLKFVMTRSDHASGTDRVAECAGLIDAEIFVNVQGDEPMIDPRAIDAVAEGIAKNSDASTMASNGYNELSNPTDVVDTNVIKVIMDRDGGALAYSRLPIPYPKGGPVQYLRQLGLYAFRKKGLEIFARHPPGPVEQAENVEMFRFLEHGYRVQMIRVPDDEGIPVDTPSDLDRVRAMIPPPS
jgi:3-deoxy-manno-octulosonate cytidylyltransferase (CMP-KDO synthetase)